MSIGYHKKNVPKPSFFQGGLPERKDEVSVQKNEARRSYFNDGSRTGILNQTHIVVHGKSPEWRSPVEESHRYPDKPEAKTGWSSLRKPIVIEAGQARDSPPEFFRTETNVMCRFPRKKGAVRCPFKGLEVTARSQKKRRRSEPHIIFLA